MLRSPLSSPSRPQSPLSTQQAHQACQLALQARQHQHTSPQQQNFLQPPGSTAPKLALPLLLQVQPDPLAPAAPAIAARPVGPNIPVILAVLEARITALQAELDASTNYAPAPPAIMIATEDDIERVCAAAITNAGGRAQVADPMPGYLAPFTTFPIPPHCPSLLVALLGPHLFAIIIRSICTSFIQARGLGAALDLCDLCYLVLHLALAVPPKVASATKLHSFILYHLCTL
ncbi:uncharacterized protein STEHIDRAFT_110876 [Stereum hirsutum FP-91666 SS1]|uniref:uncharacterized protein n=1 Tax=Stereum hirsutum (strain FP-91666) TaxID=721885 RepID=UPI000440CE79|nr:uncharacterized protein STEHIDRAFT_110876 [Stereum hirsutum FP-91666 SS1]EIM87720.1 hypothetical protein STEHIDRAFT_110876 [Stereum hirsutum FP-91666 SS1]